MNKNQKTIIMTASFLIPVIAVLIGFISGGFAPFGELDVLSAGGMYDYIPYFSELYDRVHNGESLIYSLKEGLGYNFTTIWTYYLSDPLNLLVLLFPKSAMYTVFNFLYMFKIGLAGFTFSIFLMYRKKRISEASAEMAEKRADEIAAYKEKTSAKKAAKKKDKKDIKIGGTENPKSYFGQFIACLDIKILGFSVAYALSSYMLGQGLNITWLGSICIFPLIIMGLDKLIYEGKWHFFTITYIASFYLNFYITTVISIFLIFYIALHEYKSLRHFFKSLLLIILSSVLAIGCSLLIILPCINGTVFKELISLKFNIITFNCNIFDVIRGMLINSDPSTISSYAFGIDIYSGISVIFLIICYILNKNIYIQTKLKNIALIFILIFGTFINTPNYLFNGFFYSEENICVFGFMLIFMLLSISFEALENINFSKTSHLNTAIILTVSIIIADLLLVDNYTTMTPFMLSLEVVFLYYIITLLYKNDSMTKTFFMILFPVVIIAELSFNYVSIIKDFGNTASCYEDTYTYKMEGAADYIHDNSPYARILYYDSDTSDSEPLTNTLLGYQYVITPETTNIVDSLLEFKENYNGVDIYENPYYVPTGFFVNEDITTWEYSTYSPFISLNLLAKDCLGGDEIYTAITGDFSTTDSADIGLDEENNTSRMIYYNFIPESSGDIYTNPSNIVHLGNYEAGENISFSHKYTNREAQNIFFMVTFNTFNSDALINLYNSINLFDAEHLSSYSLSGTITADSSGYIFMNIPYEAGWSCEVNGTEAELISISDTYIGIPVIQGESSVSLSFKPVFIYTGLLLSIIFIIVFALLCTPVSLKLKNAIQKLLSKGRITDVIINHISDNRVYYLLFIIVTSLFIIMLMLHSCIPFGDNFAIISDGLQLSYPQFYSMFEGIRNGNFSLLDWSAGMVTDNYTIISLFLLDPINYLYLLFPESASEFAFSFIYYIKLLLCSITFIYYLTHRCRGKKLDKHSYSLIGFGVAYGLNAFVLSYFCFFSFLEVIALAPIIILNMEKLLYEKKTVPYILSLLFLMIMGYYYAFLFCEFLFLYFFMTEFDNIKDFFKKGVRFGLSSIIAAGMSGIFLIPYYIFTLSSPYKAGDSIYPEFSLSSSLQNVLNSFMINPDPVVIDSDFSLVNIYCGLTVLLLIPVYLLNKNIKLSVRIRKFILVALLVFSFGNELLNYVFHGFHYQSMVPNRYAIFAIFLLITMAYDAYLNIKEIKPVTILISGIVISSLLAIGWTLNDDISKTSFRYLLSIAVLIIFIILSIIYVIKNKPEKFKKSLSVMLTLEILISSILQFTLTFGVTVSSSYLDDSVLINELSSELNMQDSLQITEYSNAPMINISYLTDINSISLFSNMIVQEHQDLITQWQISPSVNYIDYTGNPVSDLMLRIRYNITNSYYDSSWSQYEEVASLNNIVVHENPYYIPLGILFDDSISEWTNSNIIEDYDNIIDYYNAFSNSLGCGDVFNEISIAQTEEEITEDSTYCLADLSQLVDGQGTVPIQVHVSPSVGGTLYIYDEYSLIYLGEAEEGKNDVIEISITLTEDYNNFTVNLVSVNEESIKNLYEKLSKSNMTNIEYGSTYLSGDFEASHDGTLYLSLPNFSGFTAYVDGVKTECKDYLGGIGLDMTTGAHHIELKYTPPGLIPGAVLSGISIIIFIVYLIIRKKINRNQKQLEKTVEN